MNGSPFLTIDRPASSFKPARGKMLVRRSEPPEKIGLIHMPKAGAIEQRREVAFGEVLSVGLPALAPKTGNPVPCDVGPGETVIIDKYCGHDLMFSDGPAVVIGQDDITAAAEIEGDAPGLTGGFNPGPVKVGKGAGHKYV